VRPQNADIQEHFSNHGRRLEGFLDTVQASRLEEGCGTHRTKPEKAPCSPQDHLGPALLHELEQFPVHSLGLPSLLSDPSAKTPEEALVHIIGEARRTTPAVLYLPHLPLWWSTVRRLEARVQSGNLSFQ
jgi:hypothetical protein